MRRLGYERYFAHGGDVGSGVPGCCRWSPRPRHRRPHQRPGAVPVGPAMDAAGAGGPGQGARRAVQPVSRQGIGYLHMQSTRPQTLAYCLNDSPVGAAGVDRREVRGVDRPGRGAPRPGRRPRPDAHAGQRRWFTGSGASSAHFTYEGMQAFAEFARESGGAVKLSARRGRRLGVAVFAGDFSVRSVLDPDGARRPGPNSIAAGTSRRWRSPICWSASCAGSSGCGDLPLRASESALGGRSAVLPLFAWVRRCAGRWGLALRCVGSAARRVSSPGAGRGAGAVVR